jgi:hypothetical protein
MTPDEAQAIADRLYMDHIDTGGLREAIAAALLEAAGQWNADMDAAPRDRWILLYDKRLKRCVVAQHMTAMEDGSQDWIFARQLGSDGAGVAFVTSDATHWRHLPAPPETDAKA